MKARRATTAPLAHTRYSGKLSCSAFGWRARSVAPTVIQSGSAARNTTNRLSAAGCGAADWLASQISTHSDAAVMVAAATIHQWRSRAIAPSASDTTAR